MITRCVKVVLALAACILLCGCWVYSVYPLSTGDELLVFEKSLLGVWWQPEAGCTLTLSRFFEEKTYRVVYSAPAKRGGGGGCLIDEGRSASFEGRMIKLNGYEFLDLYPTDREKQQHHDLLLHSIYKISRLGDRLTLIPLDYDWVKSQAQQRRVSATTQEQSQQSKGIAVEDEEGRTVGSSALILTMETDALQRFVSDHVDDEEAFNPGKGITFQKRQE